jgi:magnesium transporter
MIKYYTLNNNSVKPSDSVDGCIHLYISPTEAEIEKLENTFGIDKHTLRSASDPDEVPRLELEDEYSGMIWKRPRRFVSEESFIFEVTSMGIFQFKERLIVIVPEETNLFEQRFFNRVYNIQDVLLRLLSRTIVHFLGHLKVIDEISNEIKRKVNTSMENRYLLQMFDLSESLVYYLNALNANRTVLGKLRNNARKLSLTEDDLDALDDVIIDNDQCYKQADIFASILTGLMDARGTVVNNNVNTLLKRLTLINTIFLPLNLLASIGGMSEFSAWTRVFPWPLAYAGLVGGMVGVGFITMLIINPGNGRKERKRS